jgi:hypothetical protein
VLTTLILWASSAGRTEPGTVGLSNIHLETHQVLLDRARQGI